MLDTFQNIFYKLLYKFIVNLFTLYFHLFRFYIQYLPLLGDIMR